MRVSTLIPLLLATSTVALAQTSVDRSFDPAPKDCADVRWSQATIEAFPSIGSACQSVEERNGKTYVKLEGTVEEVKDRGKNIRVDFEDGSELTFTPTPNTTLYIDGQPRPFAELRTGTELNFYIPEDRLQAELQPDPARLAFIIVPLELPTATSGQTQRSAQAGNAGTSDSRVAMNAQRLPQTAGPLPLVALGGTALVLIGAGLSLRRKLR
jgi:hypothetical protein